MNTSSQDTQSDIAYGQILTLMRQGKLPAGARLLETNLARDLGLSRTPVRDAIKRLQTEGLVVHTPNAGATIRVLEHNDVVEIYEIRLVLESAAAGLAARHGGDAEIALLTGLNDEIATAKTDRGAALINADFHRVIFRMARNAYLQRYFDELTNVLLLLGPTTLDSNDRRDEAVTQHKAIIDAFRTHDEETASAAMKSHLTISMAARLRSIL